MDQIKIDLDQKALRLANKIQEILGSHMAEFDSDKYPEIVTTCLIALASETGRLRWLATSSGEVKEEKFDDVYWAAVMTSFNDNKKRYGSAN